MANLSQVDRYQFFVPFAVRLLCLVSISNVQTRGEEDEVAAREIQRMLWGQKSLQSISVSFPEIHHNES